MPKLKKEAVSIVTHVSAPVLKLNSPKRPLDAADVVLQPVPLGDLFLTDGHAGPLDAHDGDAVNVVLIKLDPQRREVALGPLVQAPALHNLGRLLELEILARDVATKELKLAALLSTLEYLGRFPGEGSQPLRVGEGLVKLRGCGAELLVVGNGGRVDDAAAVGLGRGLHRSAGRSSRGVVLGGRESARGVRSGGVLDILGVLGDQGGRELQESRAKLRNDLGLDEVLDDLLLLGVGVNVDIKLQSTLVGCNRKSPWKLHGMTYHKLVLLQLVGHLGHSDGSRHIRVLRSGAYKRKFCLARVFIPLHAELTGNWERCV